MQRSEDSDEIEEADDNPGFWYTRPVPPEPKKRSIKDYLWADCHMGNYEAPPKEIEALPCKKVGFSRVDNFGGSQGSIVFLHYVFGLWNVYVPWPAVWILLGEEFYPAPNRYGYAPSAEFGNPSFFGETAIRTDLGTVKPFPYKTMGGKVYTPEVDFIFGEAVGASKLSQLCKMAKQDGVAKAVQAIFKR